MPTCLRTLVRGASLAVAVASTVAADTQAQSARLTRNDLVVTSDWLATQLENPKLVLFHIGEKAEYDAGHIPGARFLELQNVSSPMTRDTTALALEMLPADQLRQRLEQLGISDDSRIVVYFGSDWLSPSTRVLLTLQYAGLGARASLLDGGMPEWKKGNRPITTAVPPAPKPGKLTARPTSPIVVDADFVKSHIRAPGYTIVDARNTIFYDGPIQEASTNSSMGHPMPKVVPGHGPGAVNIVFETVFDDTGHLLPEARLRELFAQAGVKPNDTVIGYCHIGQQATAMLFGAEALGHDVKLYDGSFQDWKRRDLPIESSRKDSK
ncbi:MAG TPA: rhodanese-like domain-containing protein [Gemmatimonadaceae bacterium]|nr:rhodanese-like domain-containing protein [Gemmatimonadaceae bacterium]